MNGKGKVPLHVDTCWRSSLLAHNYPVSRCIYYSRLERAFAAASRRAADLACSDVTEAAAKVASAKEAWYSELHAYRRLRHRKATKFWQAKLQSEWDPRCT